MARASKPKTAAAKLRDQQQAFVEHYADCLNATEAAKRAGYSARTARQQGSRLLTIVDIRAEIDKRLAAKQMSKDEVLARLADHATGSMEDFVTFTDKSARLDLKKAQRLGKLHLIKKLTDDGLAGVKIELHDPQAALVHLGRYHKLFVDRQEHTGKDGGPIQFDDVKAKLLGRFNQGDDAGGANGVPGESAGG